MQLRPATEADLPFIVETEHAPMFSEYIGRWTSEEHAAAMREADTRYFIAQDDSGNALGYVILRGVQSEHRNIELKRVVMHSPGHGYGKQALRLLLKKVFEEFGTHRLWLDVFESNIRAQHVYRSLGFQQDGTFREAVYRDGKYHSLLLMSLLDHEYRAGIISES
jgi:RimJ/RimL family protein N-acetyltransferase